MLNPFLKQKLPDIIPMFQKHYVERAYAFGSVVTDRFNENSDVDLLVSYKEGLLPEVKGGHGLDLWDELEALLGRKVDLVSETALRNPYLIEDINEKKQLIYQDDQNEIPFNEDISRKDAKTQSQFTINEDASRKDAMTQSQFTINEDASRKDAKTQSQFTINEDASRKDAMTQSQFTINEDASRKDAMTQSQFTINEDASRKDAKTQSQFTINEDASRKDAMTQSHFNMNENEIAKTVVNTAFQIHSTLGPGLLESVYEEIMYYELNKLGLSVERQKGIPVIWEECKMELGFRADLIVNKKVVVELKSVEAIAPVHPKVLLTYLKLTGCKLGLLINFNEALIKNGITRIVNNL